MILSEILHRQRDVNRTAIRYGNTTVSYAELWTQSNTLARLLASMGSCVGNNVGLFLPNGIHYATAYFAVAALGKVVVPLDVRSKRPAILGSINHCELRLILTNSHHGDTLAGFIAESDIRVGLLDVATSRYTIINRDKAEVRVSGDIGGFDIDRVAVLLPTSGTTSYPKRVMLTHRNLVENVKSNIESLQLTNRDTALISLPMFFGYCHTSQFLTHLFLGAPIIIMDTMFSPKAFFSLVSEQQVSTFTAVPSMLLMLLAYRYVERYNIASLRYICFGGGHMPTSKLRELMRRFPSVQFVQTYGQTEASPRISALLPGDTATRIDSVGIPLPGISVRIASESGGSAENGMPGEILVRGPNVMKGYYKMPDETARVKKDGWLHTGDIGYRDSDGYIYLIGRKTTMIITGGQNVYPEEIEETLLNHTSIREARVTAEPHDLLGEVPVAAVVLDDSLVTTQREIIAYCIERLPAYKVPVRIDFVESIAKTVTGKVMRHSRY